MNKSAKYMGIADAISQLSKDTSTKVGAVIIGPTHEVRSMGYNGAPRGCAADEDERGKTRPEKYFWFSHAESNAITNAARVGTPLDGSHIVVTHFPCMDCARLIVQSGIKKVICKQMDDDFVMRWVEHIERSMKLFDECGVEVEFI
jgi:dCMP deaminase